MGIKVQQQLSRSNWSLKIKLARVLWWPFGLFFLKGTGRILSPLRIFLLRLFGAKIPGKTLVMDGVKVWFPWNLTLMPFSAVGRCVEIYNFSPIVIGEQSTISQYSFLCSASHDYTKSDMPLIHNPIEIKDQVWVAANCFVGPGVTIGQGCVVGACSVVTKDIRPWTVACGNPCIDVKKRIIND